ncbi:CPBP family intramembrane glutamic endopeptidase [Cytobacillus horneckiae]|uniref:CPBP family intramembrane glutamic endopeptidase n=1 Tax=Cytobacillus horneckiae TaxID=549687 RepID=UPI003D212759
MVKNTFKSMNWTNKDMILLLFITFIVVPVIIELLLHQFFYFVFQDRLYSGTTTGFVMSLVFTVSVYTIALKPYGLKWADVGFRTFSKRYWKNIIGWLIILIVASVFLVLLMEQMKLGIENSKTNSMQSNLNWLTFTIAFISAAIISPLYEEIFYRGFIYKWFRVKWGVTAGILISSIIFTIVHIPTFNTLPVNFVSGVIFAWTYEKSGSILPAIIVHSLFNGTAVILTALA